MGCPDVHLGNRTRVRDEPGRLINQRCWEEEVGISGGQGKPFEIDKRLIWEAWKQVKKNQGAPGIDGQTIEQFEQDPKGNLFKLWNRMSSGTYFPSPVRVVEIPKPGTAGKRALGIPTVYDRVAEAAVSMLLEEIVDPGFHHAPSVYPTDRSALDAVGVFRERCWRSSWVIDLD